MYPPPAADQRSIDLATLVVHAGEHPSDGLGALNTPIYQSAVFALPDADRGSAIHEGEEPGFFYGRMGNPTQSALERALCELEGGEGALALSSGMAAITTMLFSLLRPGDHMVAPESLYAATLTLFDDMLVPLGIDVTYVDGTDAGNYRAAARPQTKVFYLETPANPTLKLIDIACVAAIARECGVTSVIDNTFATPINQRPLLMGIDVVIHSMTKYLGGHGDLVAGAIVGPESLLRRARWQTAKILGGVIAPQTAWLTLRGIKTLALRVDRHNANAQIVAEFLASHPKVKAVHYPGLSFHPQHSLAKSQMRGYGGMVAFDVGGAAEGRRLVNGLRLCSLAVSLGDVATLVQHSASMTHRSVPDDKRRRAGISDGLIRLSVGIESADDIIADLETSLDNI
jgi:methionine-gamma-lyase